MMRAKPLLGAALDRKVAQIQRSISNDTQRAAIPPLEVTLGQNRTALAVLVGHAPANFSVHGGSTSGITVRRVTPGLPSELLYQRPDIRLAEAQLAASNFNVEEARAAFFP